MNKYYVVTTLFKLYLLIMVLLFYTYHSINFIRIQPSFISSNIVNHASQIFRNLNDEFRYRKSNLDQYRDRIEKIVLQSIDSFKNEQMNMTLTKQNDIDVYMKQFNEIYDETLLSLKKQQDMLNELNKKYVRSDKIDESLEAFKQFYNDTAVNYHLFIKQSKEPFSLYQYVNTHILTSNYKNQDPWSIQIEHLNQNFNQNWKALKLFTDKIGPKNMEIFVDKTLKDIIKIQEDIFNQANFIGNTSQIILPNALTKKDIRRIRTGLESQLNKLETNGNQWFDEKIQYFDTTLRTLQEKVKARDTIYEELLGKRKDAIQYAAMNDRTLSRVLSMIDKHAAGWNLVKSEDGIEVYRKFMSSKSVGGSPYACVKCFATVNAAPMKVYELFEDNTRVKEYNTLFDQGNDVIVVGENTKIVWCASTPIFPFKARDFCTVVHFRKLKDGTRIILNTATKHKLIPQTKAYVRGAVILGANIIQPIPGQPNKCKLTMITQVDPGGFAPPMIINQLCTVGPIGFMKNIEIAANKKPSKAVLKEKQKLLQNKIV